MDLLNSNNIEPNEINTTAMEEQLFNNPDPYNLNETDSTHIDVALQPSSQTIIRSRVRFDIANYIKLDDPILKNLISQVDSGGPGALTTMIPNHQNKATKPIGKPGEWSVDNFL